MLSIDNCIHAIKEWEKTRTSFSGIKNIIDPTGVFKFTQEECDWITLHNLNTIFHVYVGVHNKDLILIVVPVNENGDEIRLDAYVTSKLTVLDKDITLLETDVVTTISKTTLSKHLEITKHWKEVDLPVYNEPTIRERASVEDIEKWKNESLDWFFYECNEFGGQNIFKTFTVPFADLGSKKSEQAEVFGFFGFKHSSIYRTQIPILIFATILDENGRAEFIRKKNISTKSKTNTNDWSQPCPPLCNNVTQFKLIDN